MAHTEDTFHQLCTLCADQTRNAENFALAHIECAMAERARVDGREIIDFENL